MCVCVSLSKCWAFEFCSCLPWSGCYLARQCSLENKPGLYFVNGVMGTYPDGRYLHIILAPQVSEHLSQERPSLRCMPSSRGCVKPQPQQGPTGHHSLGKPTGVQPHLIDRCVLTVFSTKQTEALPSMPMVLGQPFHPDPS